MAPEQVVREANDRCNQENLHAQLKGGARALRAPLNTLYRLLAWRPDLSVFFRLLDAL